MGHQIELPVVFPNGDTVFTGINIRPGAVEILEALYKKFELVVFTASHKCYANAVIDYLDPRKELIQHRLYREHCYVTSKGEFVKDLRILNRELKNVVLVDNAAYSYAFQSQNGIPIIPYFNGDSDY
jgi:CTD small phosphatase-like protein 2